jgi:hypothetical protein
MEYHWWSVYKSAGLVIQSVRMCGKHWSIMLNVYSLKLDEIYDVVIFKHFFNKHSTE